MNSVGVPASPPLSTVAENTDEFRERMSAHEAGHATLGITLGARIEAIYTMPTKLPNGNSRLHYLTKFGSYKKAGVDSKDQVLLVAGGAAAEVLLIGTWDEKNVQVDRMYLEKLGFRNFDYCVEQAIQLLRENNPLLIAIRNKMRTSMINFKQCKWARKGTYIILVKGSEIEKLFRKLGFSVNSAGLDLNVAGLKTSSGI